MILSENRQKLSKRTGSTPISRYREEGYLPEALSVYLSTLSWTPPGKLPSSVEEMAPLFSLSDISTSSPVHDETHLRHWQKEAMRKKGSEAILERLIELDPRFGAFAGSDLRRLIDDLIEESYTLPLLREALNFLVEGPRPDRVLPREPWLSQLKQTIPSIDPWTEEELNRTLRSFMKERELKGKDFFHPLRLFLTGGEKGAALTLVMCVLGRDEVMGRL
jgi:glutamyl/glutaminyl-tRNA synthetase